VLQCVAVCCSVLQCVAVWCSVMQCVAVCCSVVQCVAVCCSVLQCVAVWCSVLQCVAVCCRVLQCVAVCCSVLQCVCGADDIFYSSIFPQISQSWLGSFTSLFPPNSHSLQSSFPDLFPYMRNLLKIICMCYLFTNSTNSTNGNCMNTPIIIGLICRSLSAKQQLVPARLQKTIRSHASQMNNRHRAYLQVSFSKSATNVHVSFRKWAL